jgi:MFS family permease
LDLRVNENGSLEPFRDSSQELQGVAARELPCNRHEIRRLMLFFAVVYVAEGIGQTGGLIAQPLNYFLKAVHGWTPVQISGYLAVFNLPWVIKPVYGLISDFVPLFGYRRKSYLFAANAAAIAALFWATQIMAPGELVFVLLLTAYAMAISSTLCGAILVENGQKFAASGTFVNQEWLWFNVASMVSLLVGGQLVQWLPATTAMHAAAAMVAAAPLAVILATLVLSTEKKSAINVPELKKTFRSLLAAFKTRELWVVGLFLFLYYFSPGFSTPLYYHMTDELAFSQGYIGILGSISSAGWIAGAFLYERIFGSLTLKRLLNLSIALGTISTASYLLLSGEASAAILYFCNGLAAMVTMVATLTLAADHCPPRSEGFAFAILMSISNLATSSADFVGSFMYEHLFSSTLAPLVLVSAAFTAFAFVLVPLLRLGDRRQGEPAKAAKRNDS